ncbi:MAG: macrolide ABC transporter ATP-binding protein, partial [Patescibacteria group bacterium]|nr:macrolide ABC transporter ATP-binding protein [Patescibacteria group bacterium]
KSGLQIMEILKSLNEKGRTVILVTHETQTAEFANRIIRMKDGLLESDMPRIGRRLQGPLK